MSRNIILTAVGQLPQDIAVLERAIEVAQATRADLHVVHVLDLPGVLADLKDITTFLGQAALAARDRFVNALGDMDHEVAPDRIHIELGSHALALIDLCNKLSPDLIVMRAHQKAKISEKLLGSTTDRVIAAAQTPVLVVKHPVKRPYRRIVLATNGTDNALTTLEFISRLLPQTDLQLVQSVQIPPQLKEAMLRVGSRKADLKAYRHKLVKEAKDHLKNLAVTSGQHVTSKVLKGHPAKALTRLCRDDSVDLIALGQGRNSLISRAFIGSVSRRLLRDARCDVLIWCPKATDGAV